MGGIVRSTYATRVTSKISFHELRTAPDVAHPTQFVAPADLLDKVKDDLATMANVDKADIEVTPVAGLPANLYEFSATITVHDAAAADQKVSDWEAKLLSVGHDLQKYYKEKHETSVMTSADYVVMVGIKDVSNQVESIDLDFVVHGIDYSQVVEDRKKAFLVKFAEKVRKAVNFDTPTYNLRIHRPDQALINLSQVTIMGRRRH